MSLHKNKLKWKLSDDRKFWCVTLDDEPWASLDRCLFGKKPWLKYFACQIDQSTLDEWIYTAALSYCLKLLSRKSYSAGQFKDKLAMRKVPTSIQEQVLDRLVELGYLSDISLAERIVEHYQNKGLSRQAIRAKLMVKRFSSDTINKVLQSIIDVDQVSRWLEKHNKDIDQTSFSTSIYPKLARKGFRFEDILAGWEAFCASR